MPTSALVTQGVVEALVAPSAAARITQGVVEVLAAPSAAAKITQGILEVLATPSAAAKITQGIAEVLVLGYAVQATSALIVTSFAGSAASLLDTFVRSGEGPPPGSTWGASISGIFGSATEGSGLVVSLNICVGLGASATHTAYWKTSFDTDQEARIILAQLPDSGGTVQLYTRLKSGATSVFSAGYMAIAQFPSTGDVSIAVFRVSGGTASSIGVAVPGAFVVSDTFGFDVVSTGVSEATLGVYHFNLAASVWTRLGQFIDNPVSGNGCIGVGFGRQSANPGKGGGFGGGPKSATATLAGGGLKLGHPGIQGGGFANIIWKLP